MIRLKSALPRLPRAVCADVADTVDIDATFFPGVNAGHRVANAMCRRCPEREPCLEWALENNRTEGVWGGTTMGQRARRRSAKRAAASTVQA